MDDIIKKDIEEIKNNLLEFEDEIKDHTFLITGGAGFLGSWFCDVVNAFGGRIICVDDLSSGSEENIKHLLGRGNFKLIRQDICEFSIDDDVDYVVNMACIASPPLYQKYPIKTLDTNVLGTRNVLEFAKRKKVKRFLFTSTSEVYGDPEEHPQKETYWGRVNPIGPRACYDESKRFAEALALSYFRKYGLDVRIVRIFNTYGPGMKHDDGRVIPNFITQALRGEAITVYGDGKQTRSFCYIEDMVEGLERVMFSEGISGEVFNLGNPEEYTVMDVARIVKELTGSLSCLLYTSPSPRDRG